MRICGKLQADYKYTFEPSNSPVRPPLARNSDGSDDHEPQEAPQRVAVIFSTSDTGTVGEEFVEGLVPDVHVVQDFDIAPDVPVERCERLYHLSTAFAEFVPDAANGMEYSDVVDTLKSTFENIATRYRDLKIQAAQTNAETKLKFSRDVVMVNCGEMNAARQVVNDMMGDTILLQVLIETDDEGKNTLVVILGGTLADLLKTGEEIQNVDIPDEASHQGSSFKVTIDIRPRPEDGEDIVYTGTIMADIDVVASTLLAKFCEAQNWPDQFDLNHFVTTPVLDETTLQVVRDDDVQEIDLTTEVYTQCRYYAPVPTQSFRGDCR